MIELELEKTYLAKYLPADLQNCRSELLHNLYIPEGAEHPVLRIRKRGDRHEMTKKIPVSGNDSSRQLEHTIQLSPQEYESLMQCQGKSAAKRRYYCNLGGYEAELDVYLEGLTGLVVIDFEFKSDELMTAFTAPDICLADVTQDAFTAGGVMAGKTFSDMAPQLRQKYGYEPLYMQITDDDRMEK